MSEENDLVFRYTRKQAIEDGVLVDLMQGELASVVKEAGFKYPIAMTVTAYSEAVCPLDRELPPCQDLKGRLWDVLMLLRAAIRMSPADSDRVEFKVRVWNGKRHQLVRMWSHCGPGDEGEPVITIMLEGED
jgi:hypothetical protein